MWRMLNADDARDVSRTALNLERTMAIIVMACRELTSLTVSQAKTETLCLRLEENGAVRFDVNAAD